MASGLPTGFSLGSATAGIKASGKPDLALIRCDRPARGVGMFTTNRLQAAPVKLCRDRLPADGVRAVLVNSGNANACTGEVGDADAVALTERMAELLGVAGSAVLAASTGVIGRPLPTARILHALPKLVASCGSAEDDETAFAKAIHTTDTRTKLASRTVGGHRVWGVAKGAAMIGPNLATMLAFVLTDAPLAADRLRAILGPAVDRSFHCISVEGHTSTNDTVLLLASGDPSATPPEGIDGAIAEVCADLARQVVEDGEGVTKVVRIDVTGCRDDADARRIAKTVADSALVKTAMFGNDPNWGRVCSAAGYAGVAFAESELSLTLNGVSLYEDGLPVPFDDPALAADMAGRRDLELHLALRSGEGSASFWTTDLSYEYVRLNAEYTT